MKKHTFAGSCPVPTYGRTYGATILGSSIAVATALGASFAAGKLAKSGSPAPYVVGAIGGLALGTLPGMLAMRAVLRSSNCPAPGKLRTLGALALSMAGTAGASAAAHKLDSATHPDYGRIGGALAASFLMPLVAKPILRE